MRTVKHITTAKPHLEGAGVHLHRGFGFGETAPYDPFLLFDHFAFNDPIEGPIKGFPTHPHRGIETVTYMLKGNVRHRDSLGNEATIGPGRIQFMRAGSGVRHSEYNPLENETTQTWKLLDAWDYMEQMVMAVSIFDEAGAE